MTVSIYWLIAGAAFLALEAFGMPGIGFLFAGLAAILTGALVELGAIAPHAYILQGGVCFLATTALAALLWKKVKHWRLKPGSPRYHNMLGTEAVVTRAIVGEGEGEVRWSGTLMRARRAAGSAAPELAVGTTVIIREAEGNLLKVAPRG
jgi:membrane protein implicated in regulation of membrane protease activity